MDGSRHTCDTSKVLYQLFYTVLHEETRPTKDYNARPLRLTSSCFPASNFKPDWIVFQWVKLHHWDANGSSSTIGTPDLP